MHRFPVCLAMIGLTATGLAACTTIGPPPLAKLRNGPPSLNVADAALSSGSPETALNVTRLLLVKNPRDVGALVREGEAYAALGRNNEATDAFNQAIVIAPGSSPAHLGLGRLLLVQGDPGRAESEFSQALAEAPRDVRVLVDLGIAEDMQGKHVDAQRQYQQALEYQPGLVAARVNLGLSLALAGNAPEAVATLRPLADQPDASIAVRHDMAVALAVGGKTQDAERAIGHDLPAAEVKAEVAAFQGLGGTTPTDLSPSATPKAAADDKPPAAAPVRSVEIKPLNPDAKPVVAVSVPASTEKPAEPDAKPADLKQVVALKPDADKPTGDKPADGKRTDAQVGAKVLDDASAPSVAPDAATKP
jgi:Flp pilus assembly protein TadD